MMGDMSDYDFDQRDEMCDTDMLPISDMQWEFPSDRKTIILSIILLTENGNNILKTLIILKEFLSRSGSLIMDLSNYPINIDYLLWQIYYQKYDMEFLDKICWIIQEEYMKIPLPNFQEAQYTFSINSRVVENNSVE